MFRRSNEWLTTAALSLALGLLVNGCDGWKLFENICKQQR